MRCITITYKYDGPEDAWSDATNAFVAAIDADPKVAGKFTYQVAKAADGVTRIHWGRWDSEDTLSALQSQDYFKTFSAAVKGFGGDTLQATGSEVTLKTKGW